MIRTFPAPLPVNRPPPANRHSALHDPKPPFSKPEVHPAVPEVILCSLEPAHTSLPEAVG